MKKKRERRRENRNMNRRRRSTVEKITSIMIASSATRVVVEDWFCVDFIYFLKKIEVINGRIYWHVHEC